MSRVRWLTERRSTITVKLSPLAAPCPYPVMLLSISSFFSLLSSPQIEAIYRVSQDWSHSNNPEKSCKSPLFHCFRASLVGRKRPAGRQAPDIGHFLFGKLQFIKPAVNAVEP